MSSLPPDDDDRTIIRPSAPPLAPLSPTGAASSAGSSGEALPVGTYLGEFELTAVLGEGGFGIVYLAWDHSLERKVALKEYMPSALATRQGATEVHVKSERHRDTFEAGRKSFVNEAKLLAQFDHPSLVKVYRFWEANGTAYMVMPFYEGVTLKDALKDMGTPPDEAWLMALLAPLTEALGVIHAENCFHRDIAPDNVILLNGSGLPLLLDFGAARRVIGDMTQALTVILKPGYAPVEQYAEAPGMKQGPWTDIYALAASVYFALKGSTPPASVSRLMSDNYVPLTQSCAGRYSDRFLGAMDRALRVRPEDRTASIAELREDLGLGASPASPVETRLLGKAVAPPVAAAVPGRPAPPPSMAATTAQEKGRQSVYIGGAAALGLAALAAVAYWALTPSAPAPPAVSAPAPAPTPSGELATNPPITPTPAPPTLVTAPTRTELAPLTFDANAEIDKVLTAQSAGFLVQASSLKGQLKINKDKLAFTVSSSREGYVTVLVLGPDGSLTRLFPNKTFPAVRIQAGQSLSLPPPREGEIQVSEPAGAEKFLVIVSSQARSYDALSSTVEGGYLMLPVGAEAASRASKLRTNGLPVLLGEAQNCAQADCNDFGAASFSLQVVR
jgi:serine/threonine protein kinase